jgi:membrane-bound lytic murein transglycosylase D
VRALGFASLVVVLSACQTARPVTGIERTGGIAPTQVISAPSETDVDAETIAREAISLFGEDEPAAPGAGAEVTWDIDVRSYETHARVEYYIDRFQGPARERFAQQVSRGTRYEPMIRERMRAAGLPEDLIYIALIESGFDQHAYSRAAAVGMWQFMTTTARGVGLRVDWWVDERRDPVRSTDAAIRFLGQLRNQFGSLYLAAAAYNGGPGRVSRGLSRFADELGDAEGDDRFFALAEQQYLHSETKDYVPKLIAAALVAKDPARYGLTVERLPPFAYDSVRVGPETSLAAIAGAAGATREQMLDLNGHLLRGATPPRDSSVVRLPVGTAAAFANSFSDVPEAERRAFRNITSKAGETHATIARRHGLSTAQLESFNPGVRSSRNGALVAGQSLRIPAPGVVEFARSVPDPSIERYGTTVRGARRTHVVRSGESLGVIARRYGTTVSALMRVNGMRRDVIFPGQVILIDGGAAPAPTRSATAAASSSPRPAASSAARTHLVQPGETLTSIARKYGTTIAEIRRLNGMSGDRIRVGQRIRVA